MDKNFYFRYQTLSIKDNHMNKNPSSKSSLNNNRVAEST